MAKGRRVYSQEDGSLPWLEPGDYGFQEKDKTWYGRVPIDDVGYGNLHNHTIVENPDATITVTPSILIFNHVDTGDKTIWHGFLTNGEWREC